MRFWTTPTRSTRPILKLVVDSKIGANRRTHTRSLARSARARLGGAAAPRDAPVRACREAVRKWRQYRFRDLVDPRGATAATAAAAAPLAFRLEHEVRRGRSPPIWVVKTHEILT